MKRYITMTVIALVFSLLSIAATAGPAANAAKVAADMVSAEAVANTGAEAEVTAAVATASAEAAAKDSVSYLSVIDILDTKVEHVGRDVVLTMTVDCSRAKIKTQHTVAITPVLVSKNGKKEVTFAPIVIDGRTRNKVYSRSQTLETVETPPYHDGSEAAIISKTASRKGSVAQINNGDGTAASSSNGSGTNSNASKVASMSGEPVVITKSGSVADGYDYSCAQPYERWMLGGSVAIREEVHGCINCGEGESERTLAGPVLPEYIPEYRTGLIAPVPEQKQRSKAATAHISFLRDKSDIRPDYRSNRAELDSIMNSVNAVKNNPDLEIVSITIDGYASPEGTVQHNMELSQNRSKSLMEYVIRHTGIDKGLFHAQGHGEDWEGLDSLLAEYPGLLKRDEVWDIVKNVTEDRDEANRQLERLQPKDIYDRLLNEIYPRLRRNDYKVVYNVKAYTIDEARQIIKEAPELLSLEEMYSVAASYEKGSGDYEKAIATAREYYPSDPAVLNDMALELIAADKAGEVMELLEPYMDTVDKEPVLLNTLGVAWTKAGDIFKAEDCFKRAAEMGSDEASRNLSEVREVIGQL